MHRIFYYVIAEIIRFPIAKTCFYTRAGHPHGKTAGMMVPAVICRCQLTLRIHGTAELATPYNQRILQQTSSFEVRNKGCGSLVGSLALRCYARRQPTVLVPSLMVKLNKLNIFFQ